MDIEDQLRYICNQIDIKVIFFQSNYEGDIVSFIQNNIDEISGVIINPAAFSKTGYSILDALLAQNIPYIEVHLSNIVARGGWHSESIFTKEAIGFISGFQGYVYEMGINAINRYLMNQ